MAPKKKREVTVTATIADYREALCRAFLLSDKRWKEIEEAARRIAAKRRLDANRARTDELLRVPVGSPDWRSAHIEIDGLFAEHDALMAIAFPRSEPEPEPAEGEVADA